MAEHSIVVAGFPESGKTTFLAALWHLIEEQKIPLKLSFKSLPVGEIKYLRDICKQWRAAAIQDRTQLGTMKAIKLNLAGASGADVNLSFPDVSGESFAQMWEQRDCSPEFADFVRNGNVLLFIHADKIVEPHWIFEEAKFANELGEELPEAEHAVWSPKDAPSQVQIVELLQLLRQSPLDSGTRKVAIILSAWDLVKPTEEIPKDYLARKLPLLNQYLNNSSHNWDVKVYGVSAQGCDYDAPGKPSTDAEKIREIDASDRISVVSDGDSSGDLTEPLSWLIA